MFAFSLYRLAATALVATILAACATRPPEPVQDSTVASIGATFLAERLRSDLVHEYWRKPEMRWAVSCISSWSA